MNRKFLSRLLACGLAFTVFVSAARAGDETAAESASNAAGDAAEASTEVSGAYTDDLYRFQIRLDGAVYQFPMSCADFTAAGWTRIEDDTEDMAPNTYSSYRFKKGELEACVFLINMGINTVPLNECAVGGMSVDAFQFEDAPDTTIEFPGDIIYNVSTGDDIRKAYGAASDTRESELWTKLTYKYSFYQDIELCLDSETGLLREFTIRNFVADEEANAAAAAKVTGDPTPEVLAYTAPSEPGSDPGSGIVEFAGDLYQLPAPVSVFLENGFTLNPEDSDAVVAGTDFGWFSMQKDGIEFCGTARNLNANATTIENCFVTGVRSDSRGADFQLSIPGGPAAHMDTEKLQEILAALPCEADDSSDSCLYYMIPAEDNGGWDIHITVENDSDTVTAIEYSEP